METHSILGIHLVKHHKYRTDASISHPRGKENETPLSKVSQLGIIPSSDTYHQEAGPQA